MNRNLRIGIIGISIIVLIMLAIGLYNNIEVTKEVESSRLQAKIVRNNPYLAAEYFLKKSGKTVSYNRLSTLNINQLSYNQTLILIDTNIYFDEKENEALLQWIEKGGNAVITLGDYWEYYNIENLLDETDLLPQLNIGLAINDKEYDSKNNDLLTRFSTHSTKEPSTPMLLAMPKRYHLTDSMMESSSDYPIRGEALSANGTRSIVQLEYGAGIITLMSSAAIWENKNIDKHDHAWFLDSVTNDTVLIDRYVFESDPEFFQAIAKNYPLTLTALALLTLALLWNKGMRTGPIEQTISRDRRRLPEYLNALANFTLKEFGDHTLLYELQKDIHLRASQRHPNYNRASQEEKWEILARLTETSLKQTTILMRPIQSQQKHSPIQFITTVISLQTMRNKL